MIKELDSLESEVMRYYKALSRYYIQWFQDCHSSAEYCLAKGDKVMARQYLNSARDYLTIIMDNWDEIEFFSIGDRAHLKDSAIPERFRGIN